MRMVNLAASGHPGGSLSSTDILTALFFSEMNHAIVVFVAMILIFN